MSLATSLSELPSCERGIGRLVLHARGDGADFVGTVLRVERGALK
jgi:hypothetical protein